LAEGRVVRRSLIAAVIAAIAALAICSVATAESRRTVLASVGPGGANTSAGIAAVSKDGKKMFFETGDALVAEDSDGLCDRGFDDYYGEPFPPSPCVDLYVRDLAAGTTELVSTGPAAGAGHFDARFPVIARQAVSEDGNRVFFVTAEPLVSEDADDRSDVYQRDLAAGTTRLISTGPVDPGLFDASFGGASIDGSQAFFYTAERLVTEDTDSNQDFYQRAGDATILLSIGPYGGNGPWNAGGLPGSTDGSRVLVTTREALLAEDTDDCASALIRGPCSDVYARDHVTGSLELVSTGPHGNQDSYGVQAWGASSDGRRVFFTTAEPLVDEDVEANCPSHDGFGEVGCVDIYERDLASDTTKLISTGPKKTGVDGSGIPKGTRDDATFRYATPDGDRIFFHTEEQLVDADTDNGRDVYERAGGTTTLLSASGTGGNSENDSAFMGSSTDGTIVYIGTYDALLPEDTDGHFDTYERSGGEFRLATTGSAGGNGAYHAGGGPTSHDGRRFVFNTVEQLVPEDRNEARDVYQWFNGATTLISKGPVGSGTAMHEFLDVRAGSDGRIVFFTTSRQLVAADTDGKTDVYASIPNAPPRCDGAEPTTSLLWPANRKFRTIAIGQVTDPEDDPVTVEITDVTQDEPVAGGSDAERSGDGQVRLRAERDARGDGRVYRIAFVATDSEGGSCTGVVKVTVPRHHGNPAVDSAPPSYDSLGV
jgi:hypothetical protein